MYNRVLYSVEQCNKSSYTHIRSMLSCKIGVTRGFRRWSTVIIQEAYQLKTGGAIWFII